MLEVSSGVWGITAESCLPKIFKLQFERMFVCPFAYWRLKCSFSEQEIILKILRCVSPWTLFLEMAWNNSRTPSQFPSLGFTQLGRLEIPRIQSVGKIPASVDILDKPRCMYVHYIDLHGNWIPLCSVTISGSTCLSPSGISILKRRSAPARGLYIQKVFYMYIGRRKISIHQIKMLSEEQAMMNKFLPR